MFYEGNLSDLLSEISGCKDSSGGLAQEDTGTAQICMKALSNLANCEVEEVNSSLEEAKETLFSYELKIKRINKVKRAEGLAKEIEVYMKSSEDRMRADVIIIIFS